MSTPDGELRGRAGPDRRRAALLTAAAVLAALAAMAVLLSDDARLLRLGVVSALWAAVLAGVVLARRARAEADLAGQARAAADELDAAQEDAEERVAALERDADERVAREVAAREEAEQDAARAREDAASLREELERARSGADAVTLQGIALPGVPTRPPGPRLRVVGDSGPQPGLPAVPPPAPRRPSMPVAPVAPIVPAAPAPRAPAALRTAPPGRAASRPHPEAPQADPSVLAAGSFVDQYVRSAGYDPAADAPDEPDDRRPRRAPGESATTGRTVAELLAAHAASGGTVGRRRREP
ncbi:DUF6779 domain-containing protein [Actinomycetospora rhizophila]|uniref:DUF6779 domain-containing protein n=1 Tax=Actinomycetospora rhizophila TaxID=1416876 RepID=A0ABV9ZA82_9PSEU